MINNSQLIKLQFKKNYCSWLKSYQTGLSFDENFDPIPWYSYEAIDFIKKFVKKNFQVFEFGCGNSTLFFANNCQKIYSLESNKIWFEIITNKITENLLFKYQKINDDLKILNLKHNSFFKIDQTIDLFLLDNSMENKDYESFLDKLNLKFDIIVIDSLKRYKCAINSIDYLNPNGIIILDDSERKNYHKIDEFFAIKKFKKMEFTGIAPGQLKIKKTTIFYTS